MGATGLTAELLAELEGVAESHGCELVHAEFRGGVLRVILDHPAGVTLEHCEQVSRDASALLDAVGFGGGRYLLEVSSPGLDRQLYRPKDYERFVGRALKVTFRDEAGLKRTVAGRLEGFDPAGGGTAAVLDLEAERVLAIPLERIQRAKLEIEL